MSTDPQTEIGKFAMCLRRARREAGEPAYRELARKTEYSISSISRTFNGATFPRWRFTERLLKSCDVSEEQINGYWRRRWLQAAEALSPLDDGADADGPPGHDRSARQLDYDRPVARWQECAECGSLVANPLLHQAWHLNYMRRPVSETRAAAS